MVRKWRIALLAMMLGFSLTACGSKTDSASAEQQLTIVDFGGVSSEAAKKALYEPFEKEYNAKITVVSPPDEGKLKAMVESGNVEWDVVSVFPHFVPRFEKEGLLEKLDYSIIDRTDIYPYMVSDYSIARYSYFWNIAYNSDIYQDGNHPRTWSEFWDTAAFPGARGLWKGPEGTLEMALLADGVAPDKLYPLDIARAFNSLDKIKKNVKVWWESGAQPPQLLSTKELTAAAVWNGRVSAAKAQGSKIDNEFNQAIEVFLSWVVPKNAPHKDLAMKFIAYASEPEQQAAFSKLIDYAPSNKKALELLPEDLKQRLGRSEQSKNETVIMDVKYWSENYDSVYDQFNKWLLK
ncbi:ABC transporter substrate-binding protein [Paenibacillus beijingensis]|uniref:Polyamine ABC transporter substrate-binding protein n=1 Tax=Paenibacillus beijingensis TaxID=1126833 RepID=A0A0D5NEJ4_9BACL|nr:ABC transporter substrate-binding protein [Paenibacillus beijingensis]AJY73799.1 polyamine ABC transporter substrate-binding protein [Paenibacillus beijingensis]